MNPDDEDDVRRLYEDMQSQPTAPGVATVRLAPDGSRLVIDHAAVTDPSVLGLAFVACLSGDSLEHVVLQCLVRGAQSLAADRPVVQRHIEPPSVDPFAAPTAGRRRRPPP